jgi:hypothetical protein
MKLFTPEGDELMDVGALRRNGNDIVIEGTIMGAMPTQAVVRPEEARKMFGLLKPALLPFLATFIFRKATPRAPTPPNPLAGLLDDY